MKKQTPISYTSFGKLSRIFLAGFILATVQILLFVIYKKQGGVLVETLTDGRLFFRKLILDRILIDCLAIIILFFLTLRLKNYVTGQYPKTLKEIVKANMKYLPILLISLLLFIPVAILLRHFLRNGFTIEAERLAKNFRNFGKMYVEYLIPFSIVGYLFFNYNVFRQRPNKVNALEQKVESKGFKANQDMDLMEVINDNGNIMIKISDIFWIEKKDRVYSVKTAKSTFHVRKTIKELEERLEPKGFLRVNRGVIVNKNHLHNYSYWEYDKFILRMQDVDHTEFIVSRDRMKQIKGQLTKTS